MATEAEAGALLIVLLVGAALGAGGMYLALEWPTDSGAEDEATAHQAARVETEVVRQIAARAENKPAEASCAPRAGSSRFYDCAVTYMDGDVHAWTARLDGNRVVLLGLAP